MWRPLQTSLIVLALAPFLTACASSSNNATTSPGAVNNPLPFDPTERITLREWWFNGEKLLQLRPDNVYALYPGMSRYEKPAERGRWTHETYAALFLEPYELRHVGRERVQVERLRDEIVLRFDHEPVFYGMNEPPPVLEDRLIGTWSAGPERYEIRENGRYRMYRAQSTGVPAQLTGHEGAWRTVEGQLTLQPDANLGVLRIDIVPGDPLTVDGVVQFTLRDSAGTTWTKE